MKLSSSDVTLFNVFHSCWISSNISYQKLAFVLFIFKKIIIIHSNSHYSRRRHTPQPNRNLRPAVLWAHRSHCSTFCFYQNSHHLMSINIMSTKSKLAASHSLSTFWAPSPYSVLLQVSLEGLLTSQVCLFLTLWRETCTSSAV